ncbi:hypothetical protein [Yimella sp. cx-51]|uniref:hypothetical protein n=1 Tax=Yimella sp. cx-51 TaxID=2770551 RepID=UPI00165DBD83|nr:hypothetical protein [Yimella sp. cx-51]MBC9957956.1 hypothetical protein [Yimella sp. cx-51]QTH38087.1 hypothetical protein J5M86_14870 [Yimella sp. cx-51]
MGLLSRLFEPGNGPTGQAARGSVSSDRAQAQAQRGSRNAGAPTAAAPPRPPEGDDVPSLLRHNQSLVLEINQSAAHLPGLGVVLARSVTDTIRTVLTSPDAGMLDISVRVAIFGVLTDYLPGSIRTYIGAVRAAAPGSPEIGAADDQLVEQLTALRRSVEELAEASRQRDMRALQVHGRFLESKFGQSDLDL